MNTSKKHTPGPWNVSGCMANDDNLICHGDENETSPIIAQVLSDGGALPRLANAVLIASAPELLQALNAALEIMQIVESYYMPDAHNSDPARLREAIRQARLAITKAEGSAEK